MKIKRQYMDRSLAVVEKMETLVKELLYVSKTDGNREQNIRRLILQSFFGYK